MLKNLTFMSKKLTTEEFIENAKEVHGNKYDYSKVEYINTKTKVCITCPTHGEFFQVPNSHLNGNGCPKCYGKLKFSTEEFIEKARQVHGDKYDYSKVEYVNNHTNIHIICPKHGDFLQSPMNHLQGKGCIECGNVQKNIKNQKNVNEVLNKAKIIHGDKYDYSKVEYRGIKEKVCIMCPTHGEFWQTMDNHTRGKGCPICNASKLENEIKDFLEKNNFVFETQKKFDWLGRKSLDFYIPSKNVAIECQGEQHFKSIKFFGGDSKFLYRLHSDVTKKQLCEEHGIKILYFSKNNHKDFDYYVFNDLNELLNALNL